MADFGIKLIIEAVNSSSKAFAAVQSDMERLGKVAKQASDPLGDAFKKAKSGAESYGSAVQGDGFSGVVNQFEEQKGALDGIGSSMQQVGGWIQSKVGNPFQRAVDVAQRFAGEMNKSAGLMKIDLGGEEYQKLEKLAMDLGSSTQYSASQSAEAMGFLAMAGFDTNQILSALPGTLSLAAAGDMDLAKSADIASNIMTGMGIEAERMQEVADKMSMAFTSSNVDLRMLGESFKYAGPLVQAAGIGFEEAAATIGLLGNAGIQGSQGGTALRGGLARLLNPTKAVTDSLEEMGLSLDQFVTDEGKLNPMVDMLRALEESGANTGQIIKLFGVEAGPAFLALLKQGSGELEAFTGAIEDAGGMATEVQEKNMAGLGGSITSMESAVEGLQIAFAKSGVMQLMDFTTDFMAGIVGKIARLPSPIFAIVSALAGLVVAFGGLLTAGGGAAIALGTVATNIKQLQSVGGIPGLIGQLKALFGATKVITKLSAGNLSTMFAPLLPVLGPIAIAIGAVAVAGLLIYKFWKPISTFVQGFAKGFASAFEEITGISLEPLFMRFEQVKVFLSGFFSDFFGQSETDLSAWGETFGEGLARSLQEIGRFPQTMGSLISARWNDLMVRGRLAVAQVMAGVKGFGRGISSTINGAIQGVTQSVVGAIRAVAASPVGQMVGAIVGSIVEFGALSVTALHSLGGIVAYGWQNVVGVAVQVLQFFKNLWIRFTTLIASLMYPVYTLVGQIKSQVAAILSPVLMAIGSIKAQFMQRIAQFSAMVAGVLISVQMLVMSARSSVMARITGLIAVLNAWFTGIQMMFIAAKAVVIARAQGAVQALQGLWDGVVSALSGAKATVDTKIQGMVQGVTSFFEGITDKLASVRSVIASLNPFGGGTPAAPAPVAAPSWQGYIPTAANGWLGMVGGLLNAASTEQRNAPAGAGLLMANTSEFVLTPDQMNNLIGGTAQIAGTGAMTNIGGISVNISGASGDPQAIAQAVISEIERQLSRALDSQLV